MKGIIERYLPVELDPDGGGNMAVLVGFGLSDDGSGIFEVHDTGSTGSRHCLWMHG